MDPRSNGVRGDSSPSSSSTSSIYLNPEYRETHEKFFSKKKVISERFIDYESFPKYPIRQCFSGQNMISSLLHIRGPAPVTPVLLFYSQIHLLSQEDHFFQAYIEGKTHRITPDVIATLLGLKRPSDPVPFPPCSEDELIVSKDEFKNAVYLSEHRDAPRNQSEITVKHLKPIIIPLVKICQSNILPRLNHHYLTNLDTVYLSFLLLNGYPVDLSYVIWHTMASVVPFRGQTRSVPYGIIVGRLLRYLGHPFPDDTPCADVPTPLNAANLYRSHLPFDPQYFKDGTGSEPRAPIISPPEDVNKNELPLPNDSPAEFSGSFDKGCLSESTKSIQHTMGVICELIKSIQPTVGGNRPCFEQQLEEFRRQREIKDHISRHLDHLARCHARYHTLVMQQVQLACPDQAISDDGIDELFKTCLTEYGLEVREENEKGKKDEKKEEEKKEEEKTEEEKKEKKIGSTCRGVKERNRLKHNRDINIEPKPKRKKVNEKKVENKEETDVVWIMEKKDDDKVGKKRPKVVARKPDNLRNLRRSKLWKLLDQGQKAIMEPFFKNAKKSTEVWISEDKKHSIPGSILEELMFNEFTDYRVIDWYSRKLAESVSKVKTIFFSALAWISVRDTFESTFEATIVNVLKGMEEDTEALIFPINTSKCEKSKEGYHWTLVHCDLTNQKWTHYNSLRPRGGIDRSYEDAKKLRERVTVELNKYRAFTLDGDIIVGQCPQQGDSADCGLLVCKFMECLSQGISISNIKKVKEVGQRMRIDLTIKLLTDLPQLVTISRFI